MEERKRKKAQNCCLWQEEESVFYKAELSFLCDILKKNHVKVSITEKRQWESCPENGEDDFFGEAGIERRLFSTLQPRTVYRLLDSFGCRYRFLLLPDTESPTVLSIGPYLSSPLTEQQLLELGEKNGVSPQKMGRLAEYCAAIPVLTGESPLFSVLDAFCERIWRNPIYEIQDISEKQAAADTPFSRSMREEGQGDALVSMRAMENRYAFENEMMRCVASGQPNIEAKFLSAFSAQVFERRAADPIRNAKNYAIIMNTLLRKAAERGGVHPVYLDQTSSEFASRIEGLRSLGENTALMHEMFRTYCRLVRKHSLNRLSTVVKKAVLLIDADLSADLSAGVLAKKLGVSLGYLSTAFRKETGKTISAHVRERRMEYAAYLLRTTSLQIQTVALHCGIVDVQYFSRLFKQYRGKAPTEYRLSPEGE